MKNDHSNCFTDILLLVFHSKRDLKIFFVKQLKIRVSI